MRVEPLTPDHLAGLVLQPSQEAWARQASPADRAALAVAGPGWSALDGDRVLACLGVLDHGNGVGLGWGLLACDIGHHMPAVTRAVRRYLAATPFRRIEIKVAANFKPAKRWARILGFRFEGVAVAFCDDGSDAEHWALVRT